MMAESTTKSPPAGSDAVDGVVVLDTCVDFAKAFVRATPLDASDDARDCGLTDELSLVFDWTADRGDDDDGHWDSWQASCEYLALSVRLSTLTGILACFASSVRAEDHRNPKSSQPE